MEKYDDQGKPTSEEATYTKGMVIDLPLERIDKLGSSVSLVEVPAAKPPAPAPAAMTEPAKEPPKDEEKPNEPPVEPPKEQLKAEPPKEPARPVKTTGGKRY